MSDNETIVSVDTPALVIDQEQMEANIQKMAAIARDHGISLRPHVKTHKVPWIARKQIDAGAIGITVAKVSEAEVMAEGGLEDIFVAYPVVGESKIRRAIALSRRVRLIVGVDSLEGARRLSSAARAGDHVLEVRLEVDTGLKRTGASYEEAVELTRAVAALDNLHLTGIYTYRGAALRDGSPTLDLEAAGIEEGQLMASLAERIREETGVQIKDVSLGSTPTAESAAEVEGVTEVRPGTYVFYDWMQTRLGACSLEECAARVVATVVSRPSPGLAILDGGSKTFATDVQPGGAPLNLKGFGYVAGHPEAVLGRLTEEHGMLTVEEDDELQVGDMLEIIPNHICSTVNLRDSVYMRDIDGSVEEVRVAARGEVR